MRKLMIWLTVLALSCGMVAAHADENRLGLEILARKYDGANNQFVSPVSLNYALAMAASGAEGETLRELLNACEISDPLDIERWNAPLEAAGLKWANAAFVQDGTPLNQAYIDALKSAFGAELLPLDDVQRVNAWVDAHTDHLIDRLLDDLDPDILLMLVNAIAMDAKWSHAFDPEATWGDTFHAPSGDVEAQFMHDTFFMGYGENDLAQFIRLDYRNSGLYMLIALPWEDRLPDVLEAVAAEGVEWFSPLQSREVQLSLPKVDVQVSNTLSADLQALGIERAFSMAAEFPGISPQALKINDVIQKVRVQLDEEGTRAAAVTAVMMEAAGCVPFDDPPVEFNANRPFMVLIAEEETGAVCFAGAVCEPQ